MQIDIVEVYKIGGIIVGFILFIIAGYKIYDKIIDTIKDLKREIKDLNDEIDQNRQEIKDNYTEIEKLKVSHDADVAKIKKELQGEIKMINKENLIIIKALKGCLDGLLQLNCDGDVAKAKNAIEEHLNKMAHTRGSDE